MKRAAVFAILLSGCHEDELARHQLPVFGGGPDTTSSSVVLLLDGPADGARNICSAVVVAPRVAVTAAHCVADASKPYRVQLGSNEKAMGRSVNATAIHLYPRFRAPGDDQRAGYDLAVVMLEADVGVPAVPLATSPDALNEGSEVDVIGFGQSLLDDSSSIGARYRARVRVSTVCDRLFGTGDATRGFCGGDSGGAVLSTSGALVGVIGFGLKPLCAPPGYATRVAPYAQWIRSFIDGAGDTSCATTCPPEARCSHTQGDAGAIDAGSETPPPDDDGCGFTARASHTPGWLALALGAFALRRRNSRTRTSRRAPARSSVRRPAAGTTPLPPR